MLLSDIIQTFESSFRTRYQQQLLPSHLKALAAMKTCRTQHSPVMLASCTDCGEQTVIPHSCGHRSCPHCQHHESQQWIETQLRKRVPADYFLITFTLPSQFRSLAWFHQRQMYSAMIENCWETLKSFSLNDKQLKGMPGAIAVLHTHARNLDFHPHVHVVIPAAAIEKSKKLWRTKSSGKKRPFLFSHKALANVFRAKMLAAITAEKLDLPQKHPEEWVVDCRFVGSGKKALVYLGRYLYRGVIAEKNIISCEDGMVTYRYQDSKTKRFVYQKITGEYFLWLLVQHVLPHRFRRARNFGFLHPNSKALIKVLQFIKGVDLNNLQPFVKKKITLCCSVCGGTMNIIERRLINPGVFEQRATG